MIPSLALGKAKKVKIPKALSLGEEMLARDLKAYDIKFTREFEFFKGRRWRFDFVIYGADQLAVEVDGGAYSNGRHNRGKGMEKDNEKLNHAALLGWRVMRFTTKQVESGYAIDMICHAKRISVVLMM